MTMVAEAPALQRLVNSTNPVVALKVLTDVLGEAPDSPRSSALRQQIRTSETVRRLLSHRQANGTIATNPYKKWQGPHWTLVCLAEIGYPAGDESLLPLRDQFYSYLFAERHLLPPQSLALPGQEERFRRCASQEGYAVWYSLKLGLADDRTEELVRRLKRWQWPDGGWNCDKRPEARNSSFHESLMPLRALALHARLTGDTGSQSAADRAAEVFLKRRLYRSAHDGSVMNPDFGLIHYPYFWHYSLFAGLVVMAEAGYIRDPRCGEALDWLKSKRLPDGGFPLEKRHHRTADSVVAEGTFVDWGPGGHNRSNDFVTADALRVLHAAGR
ncbi:MAG TPA: hypothetical protein VNT75_28615 [Symbiobacteriaceae bacterium]|nr:hypothetical protein [Symbiobacteriaceae bacterium]